MRAVWILWCAVLGWWGCGADRRVVDVEDQVQPEGESVPRLVLSRSTIALPGGEVETRISVQNGGGGTLQWQAEVDVPWLRLRAAEQEGALVARAGESLLSLLSDDRDLESGEYVGRLQVRSNGGDDAIEVRLRAGDGIPGFEGLTAVLPGGALMHFAWVAPGSFTMGSPDSEAGRSSDEGPQRQVEITRGFYMAQSEITQEQWQSVMAASPWKNQQYARSDAQQPASFISWLDVQEFTLALNLAEGDSLYRLPTEAEWEYAARAGGHTPWHSGESAGELSECAWFFDTSWAIGLRHPQWVATKCANAWGLYDMHGNVWEWVQDWYRTGYPAVAKSRDPQGPAEGVQRVIRGGHFISMAASVRSAFRGRSDPGTRIAGIGARLVRVRR